MLIRKHIFVGNCGVHMYIQTVDVNSQKSPLRIKHVIKIYSLKQYANHQEDIKEQEGFPQKEVPRFKWNKDVFSEKSCSSLSMYAAVKLRQSAFDLLQRKCHT